MQFDEFATSIRRYTNDKKNEKCFFHKLFDILFQMGISIDF